MEMDVQGAKTVVTSNPFPLNTMFIYPPSDETLRDRLTKRQTDEPHVIELRVKNSQREIEIGTKSDLYRIKIKNDDLNVAYDEMKLHLVLLYPHLAVTFSANNAKPDLFDSDRKNGSGSCSISSSSRS